MDVSKLDLTGRLQIAVSKAAKLLPADVGSQLLAMVSPEALATMAGIIVVWAGSHFFGIGEIADVVLLIVGWVAIGGVAVEAAHKLFDFASGVYNGRTEQELDQAAANLSQAITLIGVNTVMALLLKKKPDDTFKTSYRNTRMPRYSTSVGNAMSAPRNAGWRYRPKIRFTNRLDAGTGSTNMWGDITIGRRGSYSHKSAKVASNDVLTAIYHERVHSFVAPKFYLLRELRAFLRTSAYNKSYIMRYLEEALAETVGLMRANGMSSQYIIDGFKFPLRLNYEITFTALRHEAAGVLLGPVIVGGIMYNVYYGVQTW